VDDLVTHINWRTMFLDCKLDNVDGAVDAGTEAARGGDQQAQWRFGVCKCHGYGPYAIACHRQSRFL
jgi:hypothetical protein